VKEKSQPYKHIKRAHGGIPQKEYRTLILEALIKMNGSATAKEVLDYVEQKMKKYSTDIDHDVLKYGEQRWEKGVHFERLKLVHEGLLKKDSPRGVWEISEEGRQYYERHLKNNHEF